MLQHIYFQKCIGFIELVNIILIGYEGKKKDAQLFLFSAEAHQG